MSFWESAKDLFAGRRSLGDIIGSAVRGYRTVRIAVMGSKASGKTVFLTSLANHLRDHRPLEFPLGEISVLWDKNAIVWDDETVSGKELHGLPLFDYSAARSALSQGEWPSKTTQTSILALRLRLKKRDGSQEDVQLELVDIPGERVADFAMAGRTYREWCRWMENEAGSSKSYRDYLERVKGIGGSIGAESENAVLDAYRDFIAGEYASYAYCITPSTVKLELDGTAHGGKGFRDAIQSVPVGFRDKDGKVCQFAPLPEGCFADGYPWKPIVRRFEKGYEKYQKTVVGPMGEWLRDANQLYYLVDVLTLLRAGSNAWETERRYGEAAIGALCPRSSGSIDGIWERAQAFLWKTRMESVRVVATKADAVFGNDNRDNMVALADRLFGRTLEFLDPKVKHDVLSCSAVCSTREVTVDGVSGLEGKLKATGNSERPDAVDRWAPSDVPTLPPKTSEEWAAMCKAGAFNFQFAFPWFDQAQVCPPRQLGLNVLVKAMLSK